MNQTLEGHTGGVVCVTWNPLFRKLVRVWQCVALVLCFTQELFLNRIQGFNDKAIRHFDDYETVMIIFMFAENQ